MTSEQKKCSCERADMFEEGDGILYKLSPDCPIHHKEPAPKEESTEVEGLAAYQEGYSKGYDEGYAEGCTETRTALIEKIEGMKKDIGYDDEEKEEPGIREETMADFYETKAEAWFAGWDNCVDDLLTHLRADNEPNLCTNPECPYTH